MAATATSTAPTTTSSAGKATPEALEVVGANQRVLERHREELGGATAIRFRTFTSKSQLKEISALHPT